MTRHRVPCPHNCDCDNNRSPIEIMAGHPMAKCIFLRGNDQSSSPHICYPLPWRLEEETGRFTEQRCVCIRCIHRLRHNFSLSIDFVLSEPCHNVFFKWHGFEKFTDWRNVPVDPCPHSLFTTQLNERYPTEKDIPWKRVTCSFYNMLCPYATGRPFYGFIESFPGQDCWVNRPDDSILPQSTYQWFSYPLDKNHRRTFMVNSSLREPGEFKHYLKLWALEDDILCEFFSWSAKHLQETQEVPAYLADYTYSALCVDKDHTKASLIYLAISNDWYKWFYVCMVYPAVYDVLKEKNPNHGFTHDHYYTINPGHAGDICEHMFLRAMEIGRFPFAEGMLSLSAHWSFVEKEPNNKLSFGRGPMTMSERSPSLETYPSAWTPRYVAPEYQEMIASMSTLTFQNPHQNNDDESTKIVVDIAMENQQIIDFTCSCDIITPEIYLTYIRSIFPMLDQVLERQAHNIPSLLRYVVTSCPFYKQSRAIHDAAEAVIATRAGNSRSFQESNIERHVSPSLPPDDNHSDASHDFEPPQQVYRDQNAKYFCEVHTDLDTLRPQILCYCLKCCERPAQTLNFLKSLHSSQADIIILSHANWSNYAQEEAGNCQTIAEAQERYFFKDQDTIILVKNGSYPNGLEFNSFREEHGQFMSLRVVIQWPFIYKDSDGHSVLPFTFASMMPSFEEANSDIIPVNIMGLNIITIVVIEELDVSMSGEWPSVSNSLHTLIDSALTHSTDFLFTTCQFITIEGPLERVHRPGDLFNTYLHVVLMEQINKRNRTMSHYTQTANYQCKIGFTMHCQRPDSLYLQTEEGIKLTLEEGGIDELTRGETHVLVLFHGNKTKYMEMERDLALRTIYEYSQMPEINTEEFTIAGSDMRKRVHITHPAGNQFNWLRSELVQFELAHSGQKTRVTTIGNDEQFAPGIKALYLDPSTDEQEVEPYTEEILDRMGQEESNTLTNHGYLPIDFKVVPAPAVIRQSMFNRTFDPVQDEADRRDYPDRNLWFTPIAIWVNQFCVEYRPGTIELIKRTNSSPSPAAAKASSRSTSQPASSSTDILNFVAPTSPSPVEVPSVPEDTKSDNDDSPIRKMETDEVVKLEKGVVKDSSTPSFFNPRWTDMNDSTSNSSQSVDLHDDVSSVSVQPDVPNIQSVPLSINSNENSPQSSVSTPQPPSSDSSFDTPRDDYVQFLVKAGQLPKSVETVDDSTGTDQAVVDSQCSTNPLGEAEEVIDYKDYRGHDLEPAMRGKYWHQQLDRPSTERADNDWKAKCLQGARDDHSVPESCELYNMPSGNTTPHVSRPGSRPVSEADPEEVEAISDYSAATVATTVTYVSSVSDSRAEHFQCTSSFTGYRSSGSVINRRRSRSRSRLQSPPPYEVESVTEEDTSCTSCSSNAEVVD